MLDLPCAGNVPASGCYNTSVGQLAIYGTEEPQLRRASQYLKTCRPSETLKTMLDFVVEKAVPEQVVRKYSGVGQLDVFHDSGTRYPGYVGMHRDQRPLNSTDAPSCQRSLGSLYLPD